MTSVSDGNFIEQRRGHTFNRTNHVDESLAYQRDRAGSGCDRPRGKGLGSSGLAAFPTETVYGLGAIALNPISVARIFAAKGRPTGNPLIVHVADATDAKRLVVAWPDAAARLTELFWPGPLTLVLPKKQSVPDIVTAGGPTVAIRVPAHPVALVLLRAIGLPIAAPSANRSTCLSPTRAEHVLRDLDGRIEMVLDAGPTSGGLESTVLDMTTKPPRLLRPGLGDSASFDVFYTGASGDFPASSFFDVFTEITDPNTGQPAEMKTGTVKFFNETKGFGMVVSGQVPGQPEYSYSLAGEINPAQVGLSFADVPVVPGGGGTANSYFDIFTELQFDGSGTINPNLPLFEMTLTPVPEPSTWVLAALGTAALMAVGRKKIAHRLGRDV